MNRRDFLRLSAAAPMIARAAERRPNVVLILTDDQGYGDLGMHGNDKIRTPNMERIAREGVQFTQFHVCPVCSPTRSSLLTGRYNYRTGVVDTFLGRSMMYPDEITLAEILRDAGYRTGLFGKWHLGDNYPLRAIDQGFEEVVAIRGGGLGQPSDYPGSKGYFDPILMHNGQPKRYQGYCNDIYTQEALRFIEANRERPFFLYLPTNLPHAPLEVPDSYVEPYRKMGLEDRDARAYGMIANIDENIGRVLQKLDDLKLASHTIVIFMSDNGPQWRRYNAGMRGQKGTVYQGGIRVPFFLRWPGRVKPGTKVDRIAAHIDVLPTLAEACGAKLPRDRKIDGRSLMPLLSGARTPWPDRTLFFQWHRGDQPEEFRDCAARTQKWKLVNGKALYDLDNDPAEANDVSSAHPEIVARLRQEYQQWFRDVSSTRGYDPPRIQIGTKHENPVLLTRQDWRGPRAGWKADSLGFWQVQVAETGRYEVSAIFAPAAGDGEVRFRLNGAELRQKVQKGETQRRLGAVQIPAGPGTLEMEVQTGGQPVGVQYVEIKRL